MEKGSPQKMQVDERGDNEKKDSCLIEVLSRDDRMDHPPVKIRLKENSDVTPSYCMRPFEKDVRKRGAGIFVKCGTEQLKWS